MRPAEAVCARGGSRAVVRCRLALRGKGSQRCKPCPATLGGQQGAVCGLGCAGRQAVQAPNRRAPNSRIGRAQRTRRPAAGTSLHATTTVVRAASGLSSLVQLCMGKARHAVMGIAVAALAVIAARHAQLGPRALTTSPVGACQVCVRASAPRRRADQLLSYSRHVQ